MLFLELEPGFEANGSLAGELDDALSRNPHYRYCRTLDQLGPAEVRLVSDGYGVYAAECRRRGQRLGDIKPLALSPHAGWGTAFGRATPPAPRPICL